MVFFMLCGLVVTDLAGRVQSGAPDIRDRHAPCMQLLQLGSNSASLYDTDVRMNRVQVVWTGGLTRRGSTDLTFPFSMY